MSSELVVPFETEEGYQYIVTFTEFKTLDVKLGIPLVDVSITLLSANIETNSLKTLNKFIRIVLDYLNLNNVILYYYCDTSPVKIRRNRKEKFSNQEFRFNLFLKMFNKLKTDDYFLQAVVITDLQNGNHYTSLISKISNKENVELVTKELQKFDK